MTKGDIKWWAWLLGSVATVIITVAIVSYTLGAFKAQVESDITYVTKSVTDYKEALVSIQKEMHTMSRSLGRIEGMMDITRRTYEENTVFNSVIGTDVWMFNSSHSGSGREVRTKNNSN